VLNGKFGSGYWRIEKNRSDKQFDSDIFTIYNSDFMDSIHTDSRSLLMTNNYASISDLLFNQSSLDSNRVHDNDDLLFLNRSHSVRSLNDHKLFLQITDSTIKHMSASLHKSIDSGFSSHHDVSTRFDNQLESVSLNRSDLLINSFANQHINATSFSPKPNSQYTTLLFPSILFMKENLHQWSKSFPILNGFKRNMFNKMDTFLLMTSMKYNTSAKSHKQINKQQKLKQQVEQANIGEYVSDTSSLSLTPDDKALALSSSTISFVNSAISIRNYLNSLYKLAPAGQVLLRLYDVNFL